MQHVNNMAFSFWFLVVKFFELKPDSDSDWCLTWCTFEYVRHGGEEQAVLLQAWMAQPAALLLPLIQSEWGAGAQKPESNTCEALLRPVCCYYHSFLCMQLQQQWWVFFFFVFFFNRKILKRVDYIRENMPTFTLCPSMTVQHHPNCPLKFAFLFSLFLCTFKICIC